MAADNRLRQKEIAICLADKRIATVPAHSRPTSDCNALRRGPHATAAFVRQPPQTRELAINLNLRKSILRRMMPAGFPSNSRARNFRRALFDPITQAQELLFALVRRRPRDMFDIIHRRGADSAWDFPDAVHHRKQHHHAIEFITADIAACECHVICLPALGAAVAHAPVWSSLLGLRRVDLGDPAQAVGFGIVRA